MIPYAHQRGVSLITAVFLLVGLSALGAVMSQMLVMQSLQSTDEWLSAQALYAAESGVQFAAYRLHHSAPPRCALSATDKQVSAASWFSIHTRPTRLGSLDVCEIVATGKAGGTVHAPRVQRQIVVTYLWAALQR